MSLNSCLRVGSDNLLFVISPLHDCFGQFKGPSICPPAIKWAWF